MLCPYNIVHFHPHLSQIPCLRDPLVDNQNMCRMVSSVWMNVLLDYMHVAHKEAAHPTTWDVFHNTLITSVPWYIDDLCLPIGL